MFRRLIAPLLMVGLVITVSAAPQQPPAQAPTQPPQVTLWTARSLPAEVIDADMNAKIRAEGMDRSKIMWIEHYLTDVYGPRPIGSPNHVAAANWAIKTMTSWGMVNAHLEPFTWVGIGWLPGRATGFITSPVKANLKFEAQPWSPSTKGTVSGEVVQILPPDSPTEAELTTFLTNLAPKVRGGIVMVGLPPNTPVNFAEPAKRTPDEQVKARYLPFDPNGGARGGRGGGPAAGGRGGRGAPAPVAEGRLSAQQVTARITTLLRDNPPALRLFATGAGRIPGVIVAQNGAGQAYDEATQIAPGVILRNDDYGRISRIIADGTPVSVEFNVSNQYFPEGKTSYVTVAEIPGTDKADEIVMLGGHLDSWASGTGATDNAIGCAIMMEAARILQTVGAKPRRTIRVALWSGEEEGLLGSLDYVKQHFGMAEAPKPEHAKLDAYWNIDDGTGRVRGASIFGPPESAVILSQFFKPFEEWGIYGASATTSRATGGTDSTSFNQAGLPGIGTQQDQIEYNSTTWHTNLDNYERIVPDDVMKNAVISASVVLHIANREKMMPRLSAAEMPALAPARGGGAGAGRGNAGPAMENHIYAYTTVRNKALTIAVPALAPATAPAAAGAPPPPGGEAKIDTKPAHGTLVLKADGSLLYTPGKDFAGVDSFTYRVTSSTGTSVAGAVTITVK